MTGRSTVLMLFLSTPSARRATQSNRQHHQAESISIHALREEGDGRCTCVPTASLHFYPRPPRGGRQLAGKHEAAQEHFYPRPPRGGRLPVKPKRRGDVKFLSTPSARRATSRAARLRARNPISIHALREEGDPLSSILMGIALSFLSTPSARRAT